MQAIKRGSETFNSRQVIAIFEAYKREAGIVDKAIPTKKDINSQVQVVPTATGADGADESEGRLNAKYATRDEFSKAKDLFIRGRMSESDYNKVANRFQAAIRDKRVK